MKLKNIGMVACGFLAGTVGLTILASKEAKKVYTHVTACAMRGADACLAKATNFKENCQDIACDAREINEERYRQEEEELIKDAREIVEEADAMKNEEEA